VKIAYLIIAHNNFQHLNNLISTLNNQQVDFYIHFDKKVKTLPDLSFYKNLTILEKRFSVNWGGFSLVDATIELIKVSYNNKQYERFILLSGADYPIRDNQYILNFFEENQVTNYINTQRILSDDKRIDRLNYYYLEGKGNNKIVDVFRTILTQSMKLFNIKRRFPSLYNSYTLHFGSQWWSLNKEFIEYLITFLEENNTFVKFYRNSLIPDEMFFQTIIMNSPFAGTVKGTLTYTDWSQGAPHPALIERKHLNRIYNEKNRNGIKFIFARKFNDSSEVVIKAIKESINLRSQ